MAKAAGRGRWGHVLLDYGNKYFGLLSTVAWNGSAGANGLGVNTTLRRAELALGTMAVGATGTWTGVSQP